ncbi:MAG: hypothetical protein JWM40_1307 [Frankiales bacterium]|nr:hypothetical protein [Frankiales bacterium]
MTGAVLNDTTIVSDTVEIDAPASFVWDVIVDFGSYEEWNPFTVRVDTVLELGAPVVLHLPDPSKPGETFETHEQISVIDAPYHLQYNTGDSIPGVHAIRDQWVEDLGDGRSAYRTTDVFSGEHAKPIFDMQAEWVTNGFNATAHALKARAEQLWAAR